MRNIILAALFLFIGTSAWAQIEAAFTYSYRFGGRLPIRLDNEWGDLRTNSSDAFGVDLRYDVGGGTRIMAAYTRQVTQVDFVGRGFFEREQLFSTTVEYITLGIMRGHDFTEGFNTYGGIAIGTGILTPRNTDLNTEVRLAVNLTGGFNYFFTDKVGIRASLGLYSPLLFGSAGLFCGGGGCNIGVGASSTIVQGDLSAGVVVRLGD